MNKIPKINLDLPIHFNIRSFTKNSIVHITYTYIKNLKIRIRYIQGKIYGFKLKISIIK
jgi:hypothetical protein